MKLINEMFESNLSDEAQIWENELDTLGTNSDSQKYLQMLEKAPDNCPSFGVLANFVQNRMSV